MTLVAVCEPAGTAASTTTSVVLASMMPTGYATLFAECDPSGGDVAAWAQLPESPGWSSAVAGTDRTWAGVSAHTQELWAGLKAVVAPARPSEARTAVAEAGRGFAALLAAMPDVVTIADCGRAVLEPPLWATSAQLTLLLLRQSAHSEPATVARVTRTIEALAMMRGTCRQVGLVLIGGVPYKAHEIAAAIGAELFGVLPEDAAGAAQVAGGWSAGKRAMRTPLARAATALGERVAETLYGRGHQPGAPYAEAIR